MPHKLQNVPNSPAMRCHRSGESRRAFTLTELLVVVGTLGILALVLLPALAGTQPAGAKVYQCMNNMRQLSVAWTLYAEDNHDRLVLNGGTTANWCMGTEDWSSSPGNTNILNLTTDSLALLASYTGHRYPIYHCPSDLFVSPVQAAFGWSYRVRSVSMSCALGAGSRSPSFSWASKIQKTKISDLRVLSPSNVYVFLDEAPDSINDALFYNNPDATGALTGTANGGNWIDFPSALHDSGGGFGFADGHSEIHKWKNAATRATALVKFTGGVTGNKNAPDDLAWMSAHTPVP